MEYQSNEAGIKNKMIMSAVELKQPPIGIMPKVIWMEIRLRDLYNAINRYKTAGIDVPKEWSSEYTDLYEQILILRQNNKL